MTLIERLKKRLLKSDEDAVLKKMGYASPKKARHRLESLLESPDIKSWLASGGYDFRYDGRGFLRKLWEVLELPPDSLEKEISRIDEKAVALAKMRQPYIFIDTHFRRKSEPIFVPLS